MANAFNIEDAKALIPWLQETFDALQPLIARLDNLTQERYLKAQEMRSDGGAEAEEILSKTEEDRREVEQAIRKLLDPIMAIGILVKDIRRGLFDFPFLREGTIVNLCWQAGEPELMYWHTLEDGFDGRQPL